jgi:uncharacterized protein (DUF486 family)
MIVGGYTFQPARAEFGGRSAAALLDCRRSWAFTMWTVLLLICSNAFMTLAWYGHLKFKTYPLLAVILASWLIALPEYMFQVPANRLGHGHFSAPQLKIIQEVISIGAFVLFNALYLKDRIRPSDWLAFGLILAAVVVMMAPRWSAVSGQ